MQVLGYVRVSTEEQGRGAASGFEAQREGHRRRVRAPGAGYSWR